MLTLEKLDLRQGAFRLSADLVLEPGLTALIGPSGAGKSTLLAAVAGFLNPTGGRIRWQSEDITTWPPGRRPVSVLFQDNNLFGHLTVAQNVGLGLRPDLRLRQEDHQRVSEALTSVGLGGDMASRKPGALSGGQQGRVALARVLLAERPVVLLDEPFAALGPALRAEMQTLIRTRLAGHVVVMVTHDAADAQAADQVCVVDAGKVAAPVAAPALFDAPPANLRRYLGI